MADVAKVSLVRDGSATVTAVAGAASQTIVFDNDGKIVIRLTNSDATTARFKFAAGAGLSKGQGILNIDVAQNEIKYVMLQSSRFKAATGKVTVTIVGTSDGVYGGTVTNAKLEIVQLP